MYFQKKFQKLDSDNKIIAKNFESKIDLKTINFFITKYPQLSGGRKNYKQKEIVNAKNICLTKLHKYAKKIKAKYISNIIFKKKSNKVIISAILNL